MISPFSCNGLRAGRLPCLHYIVERPDRNSTNRPRNFASSALQNYALRPAGSISPSASDLFQLPNPLLQELPLWFLLGQRQSFLIRGPSLGCPAEPAVHICAGGMRQVIICQFASFHHRVDKRQTGLWAIAHGNCNRTI